MLLPGCFEPGNHVAGYALFDDGVHRDQRSSTAENGGELSAAARRARIEIGALDVSISPPATARRWPASMSAIWSIFSRFHASAMACLPAIRWSRSP